MSNPRKFSEKIQIQLQKQEEETRRFNEMMQEAQLVKVSLIEKGVGVELRRNRPTLLGLPTGGLSL